MDHSDSNWPEGSVTSQGESRRFRKAPLVCLTICWRDISPYLLGYLTYNKLYIFKLQLQLDWHRFTLILVLAYSIWWARLLPPEGWTFCSLFSISFPYHLTHKWALICCHHQFALSRVLDVRNRNACAVWSLSFGIMIWDPFPCCIYENFAPLHLNSSILNKCSTHLSTRLLTAIWVVSHLLLLETAVILKVSVPKILPLWILITMI